MDSTLPTLGRSLVTSAAFQERDDLLPPDPAHFELPEKAVQFGTGAFLRGFVEYFLDTANRAGTFDGRVVLVGSTGSGRADALSEQSGLYTLSVQGLEAGRRVNERRIIGSVSRALSARDEWAEVLDLAASPAIELVFSNTTEVGIALDDEDDPEGDPPRSFPGKLTRFLLERAHSFDYDPERGLTVVPCELIEDNGNRLREIVRALANAWRLDPRFLTWLEDAVTFANTLVDRIVPGTPDREDLRRIEEELGYRDAMLTVGEPYRLLAIQAEDTTSLHGLAKADPGIVITDDVGPYRERKVRLLNGSHTLMAPLALLAGHETVRDAVTDPVTGAFVRRLLFDELVPTLDASGAEAFASDVLERFENPFIRHELLGITLQATTKMRVRVVPSLLRYAADRGTAPPHLAFAFAAYLLSLRGDLQDARRDAGLDVPPDDAAAPIRDLWIQTASAPDDISAFVHEALGNESLWGADLTALPGFAEAVDKALGDMMRRGVSAALVGFLETR